jgi:hypothetical protein
LAAPVSFYSEVVLEVVLWFTRVNSILAMRGANVLAVESSSCGMIMQETNTERGGINPGVVIVFGSMKADKKRKNT